MSEVDTFKGDIDGGKNPRDIKFLLAEEIIARFQNADAAHKAQQDFISRFVRGAMSDEMPEITITVDEEGIGLATMLKTAGLTISTSESFRVINQGAVKLDGEKVEDRGLSSGKNKVIMAQVGKRKFARITLA